MSSTIKKSKCLILRNQLTVVAEQSKTLVIQIQVGWTPLKPMLESPSGLQYHSLETRNSLTNIQIVVLKFFYISGFWRPLLFITSWHWFVTKTQNDNALFSFFFDALWRTAMTQHIFRRLPPVDGSGFDVDVDADVEYD